jgi:hypothetical protein
MVKKRSLIFMCVFSIMMVSIACSTLPTLSSTPTPDIPAATITPVPPTATLTPVPPTVTPIPIIAEGNAIFMGQMEISKDGENASAVSGEIEFVTSADGAAIVSLSYSLVEGICTYVSDSSTTTITGSSKSTLYFNEPFPITDGKFSIDFMGIRVKGTLHSPSEASGDITITKEETIQVPPSVPKKFTCDYGTWIWDASAQ